MVWADDNRTLFYVENDPDTLLTVGADQAEADAILADMRRRDAERMDLEAAGGMFAGRALVLLLASLVAALVPVAVAGVWLAVLGITNVAGSLMIGLLLKRLGEHARARSLFQEILDRSDAAPQYYRREQQDWIALARRELASLD